VQLTARSLKALQALGVHRSLDDFGTGYSSLAYLRQFRLDTLKIDKSFIDKVGSDEQLNAICTAVITLSQALGVRVVAEGVEHETQATFLRDARCDIAQGYLYSKPLTAADLAATWLSTAALTSTSPLTSAKEPQCA
jgi:diguanylate cyclase